MALNNMTNKNNAFCGGVWCCYPTKVIISISRVFCSPQTIMYSMMFLCRATHLHVTRKHVVLVVWKMNG